MRPIISIGATALLISLAAAELPELPVSDTRLKVGTLVREDIFAGWRAGNIERLSRAEQNIEFLLAQRPQRTGRTEELDKFLDKAIEILPDTKYAKMAQRWKEDPAVAASETITCKTCHASGRLARRVRSLAGDPR